MNPDKFTVETPSHVLQDGLPRVTQVTPIRLFCIRLAACSGGHVLVRDVGGDSDRANPTFQAANVRTSIASTCLLEHSCLHRIDHLMSIYSVSRKSMNVIASSKPNMRALQRQATRGELVRAALRVVADRGFANTTTAAVARETGRAHGTVFVHFPTRAALVVEMVNEIGSMISARLAVIPSDVVGLADIIDAHLAALADQEAYLSRILQEMTVLPLFARALIFALQSGVAAKIRAALARDVANGMARPFDPVALSNIWIALTNHYLINRDLFAPDGGVIARHGSALKSQLLEIVSLEKMS